MRSICDTCLYGHNCFNPGGCDHCAPTISVEESEIEELIEMRRYFYYKEWQRYTDPDDDLKRYKNKR